MNVLESIPDLLKRYDTDKALEAYPIYVFKPIDTPHDLMAFDLETGTYVPYKDYEKEYAIAFVSRSKQVHWYVKLPYQLGKEWSWCIGHHWRANFKGHPGDNPWHYMYEEEHPPDQRFNLRHAHPNELAGDLHNKFEGGRGCGNGRGPDFNMHDTYHIRGLVKELTIGKTVEFPELFNCSRCINDIEWRKIERYHSYMYGALKEVIDTKIPIARMMKSFGFDDVFTPRTTYSPESITLIGQLTDEQLDQMERELCSLKS